VLTRRFAFVPLSTLSNYLRLMSPTQNMPELHLVISKNNNNNNNKVTYKQRSLKKNSDALQAYVIQCCGTGVPSGVMQKLPSSVTKVAGRLVGCSKCLDRKQQSSCYRWLWLSVAHSVCRSQPTSDADVQQAQPPVGKAVLITAGTVYDHAIRKTCEWVS